MLVVCSYCGTVVKYPDEAEGSVVVCPKCGDHFLLNKEYLGINKFLVPLTLEIRKMEKLQFILIFMSFLLLVALMMLGGKIVL